MKIERINENQIRCTLSSFDLSVRNLNLVLVNPFYLHKITPLAVN